VALFVDEHVALGIREIQEFLQNRIDVINVVLVKDKAFLSNVVTVGNDGPPPELAKKLTY